MILGILGGALGVVSGFGAFLMGIIFMKLSSPPPEGVVILEPEGQDMLLAALGLATAVIAVAGIVGGALAQKAPQASWIILLTSGISGFVAGGIWLIPGVLLIAAAIIEFLARKDEERDQPSICDDQMKI